MKLAKQPLGIFYMFLWAFLIIAGIVAKRVYGHPDWMMLFHVPAAVFLVLGMRQFSSGIRSKYAEELAKYKQEHDPDQSVLAGRVLD